MNIVTGYRGEPHITAQQDRDLNTGIFGQDTDSPYLLKVGNMLEAEIISVNEVRIKDGVCIVQGCAGVIEYGTYEALEISNGSQGMKRTDVIAIQYEKDSDTNVESLSLVVIEGTPAASAPVTPSLISGSIAAGDALVQTPLYNVNIDGITIDSLTPRYTKLQSQDNSNISDTVIDKWATITGGTGSLNDQQNYLANYINNYEPSTARLDSVTDSYSASNLIKFHGTTLSPSNFPSEGFIVIADASGLTTSGTAMWICRHGTSDTTDTKDVLLASYGSTYPTVGRTVSGNAYLKWSASRTASIRYTVYRFH